jgi:cytochrome c peroxidase
LHDLRISSRPGLTSLISSGLVVCCALLQLIATSEVAAHSDHGEPTGAPSVASSDGTEASAPREILAPGYQALAFPTPEPGAYELPGLGQAGDGDVLDEQGRSRRLSDSYGDRLVVLSFMYRSCPDTNGCPLANFVLGRVQKRLSEDSKLGDNVRLVSVSMDPIRDTPEAMRGFGKSLRQPPAEWEFLTTSSAETLDPLLASYDQSIRRDYDEDGRYLGSLSHILRVYLLDRNAQIRNIYTASFLHADTLLADIETLLIGEASGDAMVAADHSSDRPSLHGAGDVREGYGSGSYRTRSQRLESRTGKPADLFALASKPALGLPAVELFDTSPEKIALGRKLFFDRRLSHNATFSCAMCHIPEQGFASNEVATAVGIEGRTVRRNAPTLYNVAYAKLLFHDGRENRLEQQIWGPLLAANEMGNPSVGFVLDTIASQPDYDGLFERAFGGRRPSMETVGEAIAAYERALVSANSPFDRWRYEGDVDAISESAKRGFELFTGDANCSNCHSVGEKYALFSDGELHNTGIGYRQTMRNPRPRADVLVAPGRRLVIDTTAIVASSEAPPSDIGRYEITEDPADRWKYKTPILRNVALTAPYMHDGSIPTLEGVVEFYVGGGVANEELDSAIRPLDLDAGQTNDLVAFLESLTGDNVDLLIADAFAAPVGDPD